MPMPDESRAMMRVVSAGEAALGRRSYVPWTCAGCAAVLPFPREADIACPRCGQAPEMSARLAGMLEQAAATASDSMTKAWLANTASAWRGLPPR